MIEAYAFLAAFAVQILLVSVVHTGRLIKYVRGWAANYGSERMAQLYPGVDYNLWVERFAKGYRAATIVIGLVGVLLLGWLFTVIQRPDWVGVASAFPPFYLMFQMSPLALLALYSVLRYRKLFVQMSQQPKRTASLQRRGLFDFVSPATVIFAVFSFVLFFPFAIYVDIYVYDHDGSTLSKYCYQAMAAVAFVYAMNAFIVYKMLYGRKNPFVTHEGRERTIGMTVKSCVYGSIAVVWYIVASSFVTKLDLENWRPFAVAVFVLVIVLISFRDLTAPLRKSEGDESPGLSA